MKSLQMIEVSCVKSVIPLERGSKVNLAGFGVRDTGADVLGLGVLEVAVTWIKDSRHNNFILITVDTLYLESEYLEPLYGWMKKKFGVLSSEVVFNASHTHSAPNSSTEIFGPTHSGFISGIVASIKDCLGRAASGLSEGKLFFRKVSLPEGLIVNRRVFARDVKTLFVCKRTVMSPNYAREFDSSVRLITFISEKSSQLLINLSCHPVFNTSESISSDFPGVLRDELSSEFKDVVFSQGFSGDVRPNSVVTRFARARPLAYLKSLVNGFSFVRPSKLFFDNFTESILSIIRDVLRDRGSRLSGLIISSQMELRLNSVSQIVNKKVIIKIIRLGDLVFLSIPAEVNSRYIYELNKVFKDIEIIPLGYAENVIGYLPYYTEVEEGGYEVDSCLNYGWDSPIASKSLKDMFDNIVVGIEAVLKEI